MNFKLGALGILILLLLVLPRTAYAITVAAQTQNFGNQLNVWQVIQELGDNLSGTANKFTFRVSTSKPRLEQFYFTAQNTRIFDKTDGTTFVACVPAGAPADQLESLSFNQAGVPSGYEDVTLDFSCHKYNFIPGHRYLIRTSSGNIFNTILFASAAYGPGGEQSTDRFTPGGLRYGNGNRFDLAHNGSCNAFTYIWNDQNLTPSSGCFIWTSSKDDLYFILTNTTPEPPPPPPAKTPVIFIPGIGGSEFKAAEKIFWVDQDDGHGGKYSRGYEVGEKIWVNQDEAAKLGDDDYFDVLRLKKDGETAENSNVTLTGSLTSFGYGDIDSFFTDLGYEKGKNFFVFPYDWRKDIRGTKDGLDALIEEAKLKSGKTQVDIVAHSMGGLVARYYISDSDRAKKVGKLIELGVPHLGAPYALKTLMYGTWLARDLYIIKLGVVPSEVKDVFQNLPSIFQLLPSNKFYEFYNNNTERPFPFYDDRDIDKDKITGPLNFDQTKTLLSNLDYNMTTFVFGEQYHNSIDSTLNQTNGVKLYNISGTGQPTLGQIQETWWITWPINLIPKTEEIFINGDDTVPLYSASLKSNSLDLSGDATLYYVEQKHSDLVSKNGSAMLAVKSILNETAAPVEVKSEKINLEGQHLSLDDGELELYDDSGNHTGIKDNGEIETNIADTFYSTSGKTKHAFIKKNSPKVAVKITRKTKASDSPTNPSFKIRQYKDDKVDKTILYKDIPVKESTEIKFDLDPTSDTAPSLPVDNSTVKPTSEISGSPALDQTPPKTKIEVSGSTVTLTATDADSGILKIEYSLDNGKTVRVYKSPIILSSTSTLQVKAIDNLGNEEIPQEKTVEVSSNSSSSSSSSSNSSSSSSSSTSSDSSSSSTSDNSSATTNVIASEAKQSSTQNTSSNPDVLGINFPNPSPSFAPKIEQSSNTLLVVNQIAQHLGGLLIVFIGLQGMFPVLSSSALTLFKPSPK